MFKRDSNLACASSPRFVFVFIAFVSAFIFSPPGSATTEFDAAGVLLIAHENGSVYVLLGRDRFRPWYEMLAGSRESAPDDVEENTRRRETAYETALRECFEESRGFLKPEYLRGVTDPDQFLRDGSFVFFRAETDKFSVDEIRRAPIRENVNRAPFSEMVDFAWVSVEAILSSDDAFVSDDAGRRIQVRRRLKPRLLGAQEAEWL